MAVCVVCLHCGAIDWSAVCLCGTSWSYSFVFLDILLNLDILPKFVCLFYHILIKENGTSVKCLFESVLHIYLYV